MSHPYLCKRVAALHEVRQPGTIPLIRRNPLAYPLAPVLGFSAGGASSMALLLVFYLGVLAAIAIPRFKRFQERAAAEQQSRQQAWPNDDDDDPRGQDAPARPSPPRPGR